MQERGELNLKSSDRFLHELFFIDTTNYIEVANEEAFLAEGHARLTTPLLNIAMALIAVLAVVGGDFSRRGYSRRIAWATTGALGLVIVQISIQSAAADDKLLNLAQWGLPLGVIGLVSWLSFARGRRLGPVDRRRFLLREQLERDEREALAAE